MSDATKILFLDIDGVLNDHAAFPNGYCGTKWECVRQFNRILAETGASLVVSSAWRYLIAPESMTLLGFKNLLLSHGVESAWRHLIAWESMTLLGFENLLKSHGVDCHGRVIGLTCRDEEIEGRGLQIRHWLNENGMPARYVVIDDGGENPDGSWHDMGIEAEGHPVVWTCGKLGLTSVVADEVIAILNSGDTDGSSSAPGPMTAEKRAAIEAAGWRVGTAGEFLGMTPEEEAEVERTVEEYRARIRGAKLAGKAYGSVVDMTRDICGDTFADELATYIADRATVNTLMVRRCLLGLTRSVLAKRLGWSYKKIARFEGSADAGLVVGDIRDYATAVGMGVEVVVCDREGQGGEGETQS